MDKIFDYEQFMQVYDGEFLSFFEDLLKQNMQIFLEGVMQQDWVKIYNSNDSLKGEGKYLYAIRFVEASCSLFRSLFKHREPYTDEVPVSFKESLDEEAKLQTMDFCRSIFEEARLLRLEISKYSKTVVPQDIYLKEIEQIKQLHENMKKEYQKKQSESQTINSVITQLDKPENASCTEKCIIFQIKIYIFIQQFSFFIFFRNKTQIIIFNYYSTEIQLILVLRTLRPFFP